MFPGVALASVGVTVTTVSVTQAASTAPANSRGSVTARRDGAGSSATRVSLPKDLRLCLDAVAFNQPSFSSYLNCIIYEFVVGVSRSELLHTS